MRGASEQKEGEGGETFVGRSWLAEKKREAWQGVFGTMLVVGFALLHVQQYKLLFFPQQHGAEGKKGRRRTNHWRADGLSCMMDDNSGTSLMFSSPNSPMRSPQA
ncbi:hypothetical protein TEQG_07409 [Trichophyton equinum CBS 127.97]|uniref:Uncharacterized protein n=1 Tax=Trichophyton equinum (strain ATCC MYA-4606 / CBS 127.97) TaxID=559882 RepID=F2Q2Q9_TRIEC|nr:hypothetical protein TEQG_07409 [Trichophyton equinum CBS 127.97]